jgi:2-dehydropantoate 2-reductase
MVRNYAIRHFATKVGSEAIRVGQALGYQLELIHDLDPEIIAKAGEGDAEAGKLFDERRLVEVDRLSGAEHRPSMGQDVVKGRRTEIDLINGFIVSKSEEVGIRTPANRALTDIVRRVERGELAPDPRHLMEFASTDGPRSWAAARLGSCERSFMDFGSAYARILGRPYQLWRERQLR